MSIRTRLPPCGSSKPLEKRKGRTGHPVPIRPNTSLRRRFLSSRLFFFHPVLSKIGEPVLVSGVGAFAGSLSLARTNLLSNLLPSRGFAGSRTFAKGLHHPRPVIPVLVFPRRITEHALIGRFPINVIMSLATMCIHLVIKIAAEFFIHPSIQGAVGLAQSLSLGITHFVFAHFHSPSRNVYKRPSLSCRCISCAHPTSLHKGCFLENGRSRNRATAIFQRPFSKLVGLAYKLGSISFFGSLLFSTSRHIIPFAADLVKNRVRKVLIYWKFIGGVREVIRPIVEGILKFYRGFVENAGRLLYSFVIDGRFCFQLPQ